MRNKKIVIAGGTGFIGQNLANYFAKENLVITLSRQTEDGRNDPATNCPSPNKKGLNVQCVKWDGETLEDAWAKKIDGADIVINLSGRSVNCRYHKKQRQEIIQSRVNSTKAIGSAIRASNHAPAVWINAGSATIYQDSHDRPNDELTGIISEWKTDNMPFNILDWLRYKKNKLIAKSRFGKDSDQYKEPDLDFSVRVCKRWERVFFEEETPFTRKVVLRTAITLGCGGVILPFLRLCRLGLGGQNGNGKQKFSWVHIEDVARMAEWIYSNPTASGLYNCAAPNAVSNFYFTNTLRKLSGYRFGLPAPTPLLEVGAFLIGTETELLLKSRWVIPERATKEGFEFKYQRLDEALKNILDTLSCKKFSDSAGSILNSFNP